MKIGVSIAATALCLLSSGGALAGNTAQQGESSQFDSPMILETGFAPLDPEHWDGKQWYSLKSWRELERFSCEDVSVSWMRARAVRLSGDRVRVRFQGYVYNGGEADKEVHLLFELLKGDQVVSSQQTSSIEAEEGDDNDWDLELQTAADQLTSKPVPRLRITVTVAAD